MKIIITGGSGFIGTNLHEYFQISNSAISLINIDIAPPKVEFDNSIWEQCNILDCLRLKEVFDKYKPDAVIHLAAETVCDPNMELEDYKVNIEGSRNVFEISNSQENPPILIHTSSQFVNQTDFPLHNFYDYKPHTIYGESKVVSEQTLRDGNFGLKWVIIRPTNVWGKWHLRYPHEFWKVLASGKYVHPDKRDVIRSYGYVGNICNQIDLLISNIESAAGNVYYVGDEPQQLYNWVNEFSLALRHKKVRLVPKQVVYFLALIGDFLARMGLNFPITTSRYRSMTLSNPAPMKKTFDLLGMPKISQSEGVAITAKWLKDEIYN
ncbi:MAG: nucleoside-diphosphate-sugar epimerase [Parvicella sp.]|jgi:nucleoside-diphosphate-sugar epimerase